MSLVNCHIIVVWYYKRGYLHYFTIICKIHCWIIHILTSLHIHIVFHFGVFSCLYFTRADFSTSRHATGGRLSLSLFQFSVTDQRTYFSLLNDRFQESNQPPAWGSLEDRQRQAEKEELRRRKGLRERPTVRTFQTYISSRSQTVVTVSVLAYKSVPATG